MTNFSYIVIVWISSCVDTVSAPSLREVSVSGTVGSTVVLPCTLWSAVSRIVNIKWQIKTETVFERLGEETYEGEGYEGRVDVSLDALRKGDCSLVLSNLTLNDSGIYTSHQKVMLTKRSHSVMTVSRVNLSVSVSKETPKTTLYGTARLNCLRPLVLFMSLLSWLLFSKETV